jgi:hypothetical protein
MINNNKSLATAFFLIVSAFFSIGIVLMANIANAQPIQDFDFSDLNCVGMFNCNSDQSNDTTDTTTQSCESGNNIENSPGVLSNTCTLTSSDGDSDISISPPTGLP